MHSNRWMLGASLLLLVQLLLTFFIWTHRSPELVLFDTKATVQIFSKQLTDSGLSATEQEALAARFSKVLEKTVADYSRVHHVVLINPAMTVTPLPDVTQVIQDAVAAQLQAERSEHAKR